MMLTRLGIPVPQTGCRKGRPISVKKRMVEIGLPPSQGDRKGRPYSVRRRGEGDESSEPLHVLFPDFTSLVGRKPAAMRASQPISRVISVFMLELFFFAN